MQTFCGITTDGMLDYLAAIYKLSGPGERITTTALSERMHVSVAAASSMLKRLEDSNFIERSSVGGITLTEQGRLAALQLLRRHRLLEVFLIQVMNYTWDQVDSEAHRLEHAISSAFEDRMDCLCHYPTHCPHGDPIPRKDGTLPTEKPICSLLSLHLGQSGVLRRIGNTDPRILRYLTSLGLTPGKTLQLQEVAPFRGPVTIALCEDLGTIFGTISEIENKGDSPHTSQQIGTQVIGIELAEQLFVTPHDALSNGIAVQHHLEQFT
jgi:DtxR family transcriptional regulator, Mn-dependent transcriptional regulator